MVVAVVVARPKLDAPQRAPVQAAVAAAFAGSPAVLASLHAQADRLLAGGTGGVRRAPAALRGHPVVVNKWASWCGPCQTEFPAFQQAAVALRAPGGVHRRRQQGPEPLGRRVPAPVPRHLSQLHRSRTSIARRSRRPRTSPRPSTSTARARRCSTTPGPTRPPRPWSRTSAATCCNDRRAHLRGPPRAGRGRDGGRAGAAPRRVLRRAGRARARGARRPRRRGRAPGRGLRRRGAGHLPAAVRRADRPVQPPGRPPSARRHGIATALLALADDETRAGGARRLVLHAQTYARSLYDAAGYEPRGRVFMEAGIEHIAMEKNLR